MSLNTIWTKDVLLLFMSSCGRRVHCIAGP